MWFFQRGWDKNARNVFGQTKTKIIRIWVSAFFNFRDFICEFSRLYDFPHIKSEITKKRNFLLSFLFFRKIRNFERLIWPISYGFPNISHPRAVSTWAFAPMCLIVHRRTLINILWWNLFLPLVSDRTKALSEFNRPFLIYV